MKFKIFLIFTFTFCSITLAQWSNQQIISIDPISPRSVFAIDIDGDGDIDVISASREDNKIAWYENINGSGSFGSQQIISDEAQNASSVYAADIDGDGDMDVISSSFNDDKIAWYENSDGHGNFGTPQIISLNVDGAVTIYAADLDGDGDMDIISASQNDDNFIWFKNLDGNGNFGPAQLISMNEIDPWSVIATDIDGDGDLDVVTGSEGNVDVAWHENIDGQGTFGPEQSITVFASMCLSIASNDLDGDGDMDVVSASLFDDKIAWYENTNGLGDFSSQQIISTNANGASAVYVADLDGDGDYDILSSSFYDNKIAWYENTNGLGAFGSEQIISTIANGARSIYAEDLDGDGDMDVISASESDNKIAWYQNLHVLTLNNTKTDNFIVHPTHTSGKITIESINKISSIKIYNCFGQLVLLYDDQKAIDISMLSQGIYFLQIDDNEENTAIKKVIRK